MSIFKKYFTLDCISYTFLVLVYSLLSLLDVLPPLQTALAIQLFAITSCIQMLMFLTDQIPLGNRLASMAVDIADVLLVVFTVGPLIGLLPWGWDNFAIIAGMSVTVYFAVYGVMIIKDQVDASRINKRIQRIQQSKMKKAGDDE